VVALEAEGHNREIREDKIILNFIHPEGDSRIPTT